MEKSLPLTEPISVSFTDWKILVHKAEGEKTARASLVSRVASHDYSPIVQRALRDELSA